MLLMYEENCSSSHELSSLLLLPTGKRKVMASEERKRDSRPFSPHSALQFGECRWQAHVIRRASVKLYLVKALVKAFCILTEECGG